MRYQKPQIEMATAKLKATLRKGATVYTIRRHIAHGGLSEVISVACVVDGQIEPLDWATGAVLGRPIKNTRYGSGVKISGEGGMDLGFDLVHSLALTLFGKGDALTHRWL